MFPGPVAIADSETCMLPVAFQLDGGAPFVINPWRVIKATET